jgi:rare lipoprotein A
MKQALHALCIILPLCGCAELQHQRTEPQAAPASIPVSQLLRRPGGYYKDDGPDGAPPMDLDAIADAQPKPEPLHPRANDPYIVFGKEYVPEKEFSAHRKQGTASWYGRKFHGQRTWSGEIYDMYAMTAAHPTLPIPSYARVTNLANGRSVILRVNDRGPFHSGRLIDLSYAAAYKLGYAGTGSASVEVESITREDMPMIAAQRQAAQTAAAAAPQSNAEQPAAETKSINPVILASASPLQPELAGPAPPIPVDADAGGIYLQLGAFSGRDNAENFRIRVYQQLTWLNDAIQIFSRDGMFRLHLGPYRDRDEANVMAEKIREALQFKPVVVVR